MEKTKDIFSFTRNLRLQEFFAAKTVMKLIMRKIPVIIVSNMSNATLILNQHLLILLVEIQILDFYVDSLTNEVLQNDKKI